MLNTLSSKYLLILLFLNKLHEWFVNNLQVFN